MIRAALSALTTPTARAVLIGLAALAVVSAIGAVYWTISSQRDEIETLRTERDAARTAAEDARADAEAAATALDVVEQSRTRAFSAATVERSEHDRLTAKLAALTKEAIHADPKDDGPVAPVLDRFLDGLRGAGADGGSVRSQ